LKEDHRSIRLQHYDYSQPGTYFITICILNRECRFGDMRGGSRTTPSRLGKPKSKSSGRLLGAYKTVSTKRINEIHKKPGAKLWQRNYYEHIIRSENELNRIRAYIEQNPAKREFDRENPSVLSPNQEAARW
jgi:hypothetical protein